MQQNMDIRDQSHYTKNIDSQNNIDAMDIASSDKMISNPMINKRILLKLNYDLDQETEANILHLDGMKQSMKEVEPNIFKPDSIKDEKLVDENVIYDKIKLIKPIASKDDDSQNHGRVVIYGDSNCLDSTHIEKACFWLLDALLEYTMSSHVSNVLKDLSRSPNIQFTTNSMSKSPKRLPNNHLHLYSKVLMPNQKDIGSSSPLKRPIPKCTKLWWDSPIFLNISASNHFYGPSKDSIDMEGELNLRRKLESQKGEVRSICYLRAIKSSV